MTKWGANIQNRMNMRIAVTIVLNLLPPAFVVRLHRTTTQRADGRGYLHR